VVIIELRAGEPECVMLIHQLAPELRFVWRRAVPEQRVRSDISFGPFFPVRRRPTCSTPQAAARPRCAVPLSLGSALELGRAASLRPLDAAAGRRRAPEGLETEAGGRAEEAEEGRFWPWASRTERRPDGALLGQMRDSSGKARAPVLDHRGGDHFIMIIMIIIIIMKTS